MPCDRLPRCSSHSSSPYPSRPSSRLCSRPSSPSAVQNQPSQSRLRTLPSPYPTVLAKNIYTPPHIQINGQPQSHSAPQQPLELPGVAVPGTSSSTLHDNPQILSLPPCPPFSFESPLSPSRRNIVPAFDVWFGNIPITNAVAQVSSNTHRNPSVHPLFENSQHPLPNVGYHPAGHQPSNPLNTSPSLDTIRPHANLSIPSQSSLVHLAPPSSVNHNHSTSVEHHLSCHVYHTAPQRPQPEQVLQTRSHPEQQSIMLQQTSQLPDHCLQRQASPGQGMFYQASNFSLQGAVLIDNNAPNLTLNMSDNNFMSSFLKETIIGAEFDSSDPTIPLQCHPGTRLEIVKRCLDFVLTCNGPRKLRWVVGSAGVGKSAIMQSVARDLDDISDVVVGATIFFSINGRQDGTKTVNTIAYQLATKLDSYRIFVQREITRDPSYFRKSLPTQFDKFIIDPFIRRPFLPPSSRVLIILDGLDECANISTQKELLGLISSFCMTYPFSPIVWMVASRPEPHITSFFFQPEVATSYEKEEIKVNSAEAYEDVKLYLRDKFREIRLSSIALRHLSQWPCNDDFFKITNASGGLFAYASAVVRYISNPIYGDPASQLDDVLKLIDGATNSNLSGEDHPMAQLDALYKHIMSRTPAKMMANTRKLLLLYAGKPLWDSLSFRLCCNLLGMTENAAYGATHHIRAVAIIPEPAEAATEPLKFFHKSFYDYLRDFERSGFSPNIRSECEQLDNQLTLNVIRKAPNGVHKDRRTKRRLVRGDFNNGFKNCPGTRDNISVSWPGGGKDNDYEIRFEMFDVAVYLLLDGLERGVRAFQSLLCMHVLTTCLESTHHDFPVDAVRDFPFQEPWRSEFLEHGILKQVPLETIDIGKFMDDRLIQLWARNPTTNARDKSCLNARKGHSQDWTTKFEENCNAQKYACEDCSERFDDHFEKLTPDHLVTVLQVTPDLCIVELRFVDPEDSLLEWTCSIYTPWLRYGEAKDYDESSDSEDQSDDDI